jgi:hypothetical protein
MMPPLKLFSVFIIVFYFIYFSYLLEQKFRVFVEAPEFERFIKNCKMKNIPFIQCGNENIPEFPLFIASELKLSFNSQNSEKKIPNEAKLGHLEWIEVHDPLNEFTGLYFNKEKKKIFFFFNS